jgi:hypothetical protein
VTDEALEGVLRLLAEGRLTAEEAGPIIDALGGGRAEQRPGDPSSGTPSGGRGDPGRGDPGDRDDSPGRTLRVQVTEKGRTVINLRIPLSLGRAAISQVPGISEATSDRIREAIEAGVKGSILEVDDAGDGVRILIE